MLKPCKFCGKEQDFKGKRKFCDNGGKCKKAWENSQRGGGLSNKGELPPMPPPAPLVRPDYLKDVAAEYWDRVAPILTKRGHLNELSIDIFVELCILIQALRDINNSINETNQSFLQIDDKRGNQDFPSSGARTLFLIDDKIENKNGGETQACKESALSDVKRKYLKLLLEYSKQFYLTPLSVRGNFGISDGEKDPLDEFIKGQNVK